MPHLNTIRRVAARRVRDGFAAEDITQEVYLTAWSAFDRYECGTNCRAWLIRILFHTIQRHRRKSAPYQNYVTEDFFESLPSKPEARWEISDEDLLQAIGSLPEHLRAAVEAVDIQELTYAEAAATLGIPIGTVMSRLSRAREQLRRCIGGRNAAACLDLRK